MALRAKKGFTDLRKRGTFETNFGFLGDRAVQFDVGSVVFSEEILQAPEREMQRMKDFLYSWAETKRLVSS